MARKLTIKRLTKSDLTIFYWHFINHRAGNQKAINLNADILVEKLYPDLDSFAQEQNGKLPIDLFIYGPGLGREYNLQRKIIKWRTYKNWRLDGEYVLNPDESPDRFNSLQPNDYGILEFIGAGKPSAMKIFLVAAEVEEDKGLHAAITEKFNFQSMVQVTEGELEQLINSIEDLDPQHPINQLILVPDSDIEDAALVSYK